MAKQRSTSGVSRLSCNTHRLSRLDGEFYPRSFMCRMDIHPGRFYLTVALHHTQKSPPIFFVKRRGIRYQAERRNAFPLHIHTNVTQHFSRNSLTAILLFHIDGTYVWSQVFSRMKIICDHAQPTNNFTVIVYNIPLWNGIRVSDARMHAIKVPSLNKGKYG